jgi:hypothetical protein
MDQPGMGQPPMDQGVAVDPNLICPITGSPLHQEGSDLVSSDGTHRYACEPGIFRLFVPEAGATVLDAAASKVQEFYEEAPFPNYNDVDDVAALVKRADTSVFGRLLREPRPLDVNPTAMKGHRALFPSGNHAVPHGAGGARRTSRRPLPPEDPGTLQSRPADRSSQSCFEPPGIHSITLLGHRTKRYHRSRFAHSLRHGRCSSMWIQHPEPTGSGEQRPTQICNIKRDIPALARETLRVNLPHPTNVLGKLTKYRGRFISSRYPAAFLSGL